MEGVGMTVLVVDGLELYFCDGPAYECTATNVAAIVRRYAERAGVTEIPPVSLSGGDWWRRPWEEIAMWQRFSGEAGASPDAEALGVRYRCLVLRPNLNPIEVASSTTLIMRGTLKG
jgi:hypothetical protein